MAENNAEDAAHIDTLIFDVDDCMYPVSSGFSDHRLGEVILDFMVERLGFGDRDEAYRVRLEYFQRYHSVMKGLKMAGEEGRLKHIPFREKELGDWFAERCDHDKYLKRNLALAETLVSLRDDAGLKLVIFSNAPRRYVLRCLDALGVCACFRDEHVFGVEDVMPACKPEAAAFEHILKTVGSTAARSVMFEDSMKNVRGCHALGLYTVLIDENAGKRAAGGEAGLIGDVAQTDDPAVGATLENINQIRERLPFLWERRFERMAEPPRKAKMGKTTSMIAQETKLS